MRRFICLSCFVASFFLGSASAFAQPPSFNRNFGNRTPGPAISPYLNLLRGGSTAANYYGLVRPQQEFRAGINNLQGEIQGLGQAITNLNNRPDTDVHETGHHAGFMTHGSSFMNVGSPGLGNSGGSASRSSQITSKRPSSRR